LKNALRSKDEEIRHVKELARLAMHEVEELKQRASRASPSSKATPRSKNLSPYIDEQTPRAKNLSPNIDEPAPRKKNFSPDIDTYESEGRRYESAGGEASSEDIVWDEMDNMKTSKPTKSPPRPVAEESPTRNRRSIENDAIRSYMRHKRRNYRQ